MTTITYLSTFSLISVIVLELIIYTWGKNLRKCVTYIEQLDSKLNLLNVLSSLLLSKSISLQDIVSKIVSSKYFQMRYSALTLVSLKIPQAYALTPLDSYAVRKYIEKQKKFATPQLLKIDLSKLSAEEKIVLSQNNIGKFIEVLVIPIFYQLTVMGYLILKGGNYRDLSSEDPNFLNAVGESVALIMKSVEVDGILDAKEQFRAINVKW
ncbi:MAG: hypothetical protein A3D24_01530 [Candidatus Blackburnbacteria bacterium RIFCSPHIGHO2_02_FULL_39_13]|uniref:Uncharacterized protein n=1 Tax=Candidatus Blackburnbacteria bacterium RIFCSPLOWO2_01_FULL_40_20 TaxID=1797519 RepID=A0A1G1VCU0_9BACT|nr:MAG: hypothetical protein UT38_C0010G0007 [Microgenomates group bacterium GW2011_GWA2_39_19]OGY06982.1 MAG: hypothetical protein A2694_02605 [Candidatus Blackburnbacteria bacterium RIFCSPHIGHO2_01_FULL_40_17]OGY08724.1 MAG: hypothetical protein A3D24_01530 [Candidatus Blackburnbacteria bacterium RIFCSPHIGHO2_02_FULL_39_13]OGY13238.1 MAG: hypothetical protein A3A77_01555 [Candidatus Blackburnbacteria bacterium RIFCSPLOWO2_01_FULL_40_20]HBL52396.1 hypothetical protein [Candidatus Blackburnbact